MNLDELRKFKPQLMSLAAQYNLDPESIRVFGSVARKEENYASDVDLLVHPLYNCSLFDLGGFYEEVKDLLKTQIDIVPDDSIRPLIKPYIEKDVIYL